MKKVGTIDKECNWSVDHPWVAGVPFLSDDGSGVVSKRPVMLGAITFRACHRGRSSVQISAKTANGVEFMLSLHTAFPLLLRYGSQTPNMLWTYKKKGFEILLEPLSGEEWTKSSNSVDLTEQS